MRALGCVAAALLLAAALAGCRGADRLEPLAMVDLFTFAHPDRVRLAGVEGLEQDAAGSWRWLLGPRAVVRFHADRPGTYVLRFGLMNPIPGNIVTLSANGRQLAAYGPLPAVKWLSPSVVAAVAFEAEAGDNELVFAFSDWNRRAETYMPTDARPLAAVFLDFLLYAREPAGS